MSALLERTDLVTADGDPLLVLRDVRRAQRGPGPSPRAALEVQGYISKWDSWHMVDDPGEARRLGLGKNQHRFLESVQRCATLDSFARHAAGTKAIRLLFNHGLPPGCGDVGQRPIGVFTALREDDHGPFFSARLLTDASYVAELLPSIEAGQLKPSYRFIASQGTVRRRPPESDFNPAAMPEVTITEAAIKEISLCTFALDPSAESSVVSAQAMAA